jgi:general secretion pathway protein A
MYESFYGLREKPFSLLPDPAFLFLTQQHDAAYSLLEYSVLHQAGVAVVTGDVGCGKTILIRHLLNQLTDDVNVGLISNTHPGLTNILEWVMLSFGIVRKRPDPVSQYDALMEFLISAYGNRQRSILVIDEAQNLDEAALEELRALSNINSDKDQILQIVLVGQPELRRTLQRLPLRQLAQRIAAHYHLGPLSEVDTIDYVRHRLRQAGAPRDLFTAEAVRRIHRHAGGIPRLINLLCNAALVYGYADDIAVVDADLVDAALDDQAAGIWSASGDEESPHGAAGPHRRSNLDGQTAPAASVRFMESTNDEAVRERISLPQLHAGAGSLTSRDKAGTAGASAARLAQPRPVHVTDGSNPKRALSVASTIEKAMLRRGQSAVGPEPSQ